MTDSFFLGNRKSRWWVVAIGMIGSSVSGISPVSVPGMVVGSGFAYLQMCFGFIFGYVVVALVLLPLYYKLNLISIYGYLQERFGTRTHKTGAWYFIVSKIITSASKLYVAVLVLQTFVFAQWGIPLWLTVCACVGCIWLYTFRRGVGTVVWTDALQTLILLTAIILMLVQTVKIMNISFSDAVITIKNSPLSQIFVWDWASRWNFWKQFASGIFIVIVMTGLNQDMMQTTLSCRNLREAQKNMLSYSVAFIPLNLLLLSLGALLVTYAGNAGIALPAKADEIVPMFASGLLGTAVQVCFVIGIIAATFNSADGALIAIATSLSVDIFNVRAKNISPLRKIIYPVVCATFALVVQAFAYIGTQSILDSLYTIVGYAYGPLLGLFAFGLLTKHRACDRAVPYIAIASPVLTFLIDVVCQHFFNYKFGYELLMLNGMIMFLGLFLLKKF
ncbi:MAG: sodium:solute symporter [Prevotellaceae bacterium]|jgi:Na+/proline symporter|nr:sodium:solute symporter [Prevotellaceae bacterium]